MLAFSMAFGSITPAFAVDSEDYNNTEYVFDYMPDDTEIVIDNYTAFAEASLARIAAQNVVTASSFEGIRQAVNAAGSTPTTILLTAPVINTGAGVAGQQHGGGANSIVIGPNQNITILNGLLDSTSRVTIVRDISNTQSPNAAGGDPAGSWNHVNNMRSHEIFAVEGTLRLGTDNPDTPQANNITLDNTVRRINHSGVLASHPHNNPSFGTNVAGGQMRGGLRVRGANAHFHMHDGVIIQYGRHEDEGANMRITHGGTFHMHGGTIRRGFGDASGGAGAGGGIFIAGAASRMYMHGGVIEENELSINVDGGGIAIVGGATVTMYGGYIRNHALVGNSRGGAVSIGVQSGTNAATWAPAATASGTFNMHGGVIEGNSATLNGAGIFVSGVNSIFNMTAGTIRNNSLVAGNSNGGGVFTTVANYSNLNIGNVNGVDTSDQIHFYGNRSGAHNGSPLFLRMGVLVALNDFPNIRWDDWQVAHHTATTSLPDLPAHIINNWDINIAGGLAFDILRVLTMVNGGENTSMSSSNPMITTETPELLTLDGSEVTITVGTRDGFDFSHWTTAPILNQIHNSTSPTVTANMPSQNVTVTAHWTRNVTFDLNGGNIGGDNTNPVITIAEDSAVGVANMPTAPTRIGYDFIGWELSDGSAFDGTIAVPGGHFTVIAQWKPIPKVLTFDANGGDLGTVPGYIQVNQGNSANDAFPTSEPTRINYIFTGWNSQADGRGTPITNSTIITGDITVYAQWIPNMLTVTFDANGGSLGLVPDSIQVQQGSTANGVDPNDVFPIEVPTRGLYGFAGWNTEAGGSGTSVTAETVITENITAYAQWSCILREWDPFETYNIGDLVSYDGRVWRALNTWRGHGDLNWRPTLAHSLWIVTNYEIPTVCSIFIYADEWNANEFYTAGDYVIFNGNVFRALLTHQGFGDVNWNPEAAPSLWELTNIAPSSTRPRNEASAPTVPAWDSFGLYFPGDRVYFNGRIYEAITTIQGHGDTNWNPAVLQALWRWISE